MRPRDRRFRHPRRLERPRCFDGAPCAQRLSCGALGKDRLLQGKGVDVEPQAAPAQYRQCILAGGPRYLIHLTTGGRWQGAKDGYGNPSSECC